MSLPLPSLAQLSQLWAESMLRACGQGTLVLAAVWVLCRVWPHMTPQIRCWLWRLAYLKLLVSLVWNTPLTLPLLPAAETGVAAQVVHVHAPTATPQVGLPQQTVPGLHPAPTTPVRGAWHIDLTGLLGGLWLLGMGLCSLRIGRIWYTSRHLLRASTPLSQAHLLTSYARLCAQLGIATPPVLRVTSTLASPALVGWMRPTILVPASVLATASPRQCELMLAHELAHVRRHDLLWQWLPTCAQILYFFHPLVWLAHREYGLAQEMACDAVVVLHTRAPAVEYGHVLISVATERDLFRAWGYGTATMRASPATLVRRLTALAWVHTPTRRGVMARALLIVALAMAILVPWRFTAPQGQALAVSPNGAAEPSALHTAVRELIASYNTGDTATLARYVLPTVEGYYQDNTLRVMGFQPAALAAAFAAGYRAHLAIEALHVWVFGHTAAVTVELTGTLASTVGPTATGPWRMAQMWQEQDGQWRLVHYQGFPLFPWEMRVQDDLRRVLRRGFQAILDGDAAAAAAAFAPHAHLVTSHSTQRIEGREAIQQSYARWFKAFPTIRFDAMELAMQVYNDATAVSYASYTITEVNTAGWSRQRRMRVTATRVKIDGQWLIVNQHHSPLPQ